MIKASFTDYISEYRRQVVRYVVATWPATRSHARGSVTVYREFENGKKQVRKLCYIPISGYMIDVREPNTWCVPIIECKALSDGYNVYGRDLTEEEKETIVKLHPEFRWTLKKAGNINCAKTMRLLQQWLKDKNVEFLVDAKYDKLACNKSFIRYGKEKQKNILNFVRTHEGSERWPMQMIQFVMGGKTVKEYEDWKSFRDSFGKSFPYNSYKYLSSRKNGHNEMDFYRDYYNMAKECGHDMGDKYWYAPKNLKKAHDKVMKEVELLREAKRRQQAELQRQEEQSKNERFSKFGKKFSDIVVRQGSLIAYVPDDAENVDRHAKALHQCLVYSDYIGKMAKHKIVLVFIVDKKRKPVATAEILPGGKIGQFYADEEGHDYEKMEPCPDAVKILDKWIGKFKESKIKIKPVKESA